MLVLTLSFAPLSLVVGILTSTYGLSYLTTLGVSSTTATLYAWVARIPGLLAFIAAALIADTRGRFFTLRTGNLLLLPSILLFFPLVNLNTFLSTLVAFIIIEVPVDFASGSIAALFTESFPTKHRGRGAGLSYYSGALISAFVLTAVLPAIISAYGNVKGAAMVVSIMLAGFVALALLASLWVRETLKTEDIGSSDNEVSVEN